MRPLIVQCIVLANLLVPAGVFASTGPFAPGTVTDPGCLPSDPLCIITTSTSSFTTLTSQTIAASSSVITAATSTSLFSSALTALSGWFSSLFASSLTATNGTIGTLTATSSATLASTTITGPLTLASVATGTPSSPVLTLNPSTGQVEQVTPGDILLSNLQNSLLFSTSTNILTSNINGVVATTSITIPAPAITNSLVLSGNTLTSSINGILATSPTISAATSTSVGNLWQIMVNGIASNASNIINSLSLTSSGNILTADINGVTATTTLPTPSTTNTLSLSGNTLTSTVNGVAATAAVIATSTLSSVGNSLQTMINGVASNAIALINSLSTSLSGNTLTTTINGVSATSSVISSNTLTYSSSTGLLSSAVNGVSTTTTIIPNLSTSYGILGIANGGTGTTTAPTFGQLLMGNGSGGYNLVATSTLGFSNYWTLSGSNLYNNSGTNVGIGTTTPASRLSVVGGDIFADGSTVGTWSNVLGIRQGTSTNYIQVDPNGSTYFGSNHNADFIFSVGNVGIGTITPTAQLTTTGTVRFAGLGNSTTNTNLITTDSNGDLATSTFASLLSMSTSTLATTYFAQGGNSFGANAILGTNDNYPLLFETNGGTRMTILANGNVGIGTTSPTTILDVNLPDNGTQNAINFNGQRSVGGSHAVRIQMNAPNSPVAVDKKNFQIINANGTAGTENQFMIRSVTDAGAASSYGFVMNHSGNVGIGTASPADALQVSGNIAASGLNAVNTISQYYSGGGVAIAGLQGNTYGTIQAYSDSAGTGKALSLNPSGGNVGIGTSTPTDVLDIFRNSANYVRSRITNTTASGGSGLFFGSDVDPLFHSYIVTNNSANSSFAGSNSLNILNSRGDIGFFAAPNGISERMRITSAGNVGIGTTTPTAQLTTTGTVQHFGLANSTTNTTILTTDSLGNLASSSLANLLSLGSTTLATSFFAQNGNSFGTNAVLGTNDAYSLYLKTNGINRIMIASSTGYVGIGNTSPEAFLTVGPVLGTRINTASSSIISSPAALGTNLDDFNWVSEFRSSSPNIDRLMIGEHRTLAGTSWTTAAWRIQPAIDNLYTTMSANRGFLEFAHGTAGAYQGVGISGSGGLIPDVVVASNGNVGVGTTTPSNRFVVTQALSGGVPIVTTGTDPNAITSFNSTGGATLDTGMLASGDSWFQARKISGSAGALNLLLNPSGGAVGIGTTTPTAQLHTTGTVRFANFGAGTLTTDASGNLSVSSDERLKNVDGTFTRSLADIVKINPIQYHWNTLSGLDQSTQYSGFSAQNMLAAIPEAVGSSTSGYFTLQDRPILATIVNALKDIANITGLFKDNLVAWLGSGGNGVKKVSADKLCTRTSGGTEVCITGDQLQQVLQTSGLSGTLAPAVGTGGSVGGVATQSDTTTTDTPAASSSDPVISTDTTTTTTDVLTQ